MGVAASLSDVAKATEPGRLEQLRPQELSRVQEPVAPSGEKARLSEASGGKKSLSLLHHIRGPAPKDVPVPLSHSINGKSKPWEPFMAEEFAHQFHESVLQSTQKALQKHKGTEAAWSVPVPVPLPCHQSGRRDFLEHRAASGVALKLQCARGAGSAPWLAGATAATGLPTPAQEESARAVL